MKTTLSQADIAEFKELLDKVIPNNKESVIQDFLESHSQLLPTPILLNHDVHLGAMISKFAVDNLKTDLAYLTKSSREWKTVLIELENPDKSIFNGSVAKPEFTSEFNSALQQVLSWDEFLREHGNETRRRLSSLIVQLADNPMTFRYVLVIGRTPRAGFSKEQIRRLNSMEDKMGISILTYDNLITGHENRMLYGSPGGPGSWPKNILRQERNKFTFRKINSLPSMIFAWLSTNDFVLHPEHREILRENGVDIDKWEEGHSLSIDGKYYPDTISQLKSML